MIGRKQTWPPKALGFDTEPAMGHVPLGNGDSGILAVKHLLRLLQEALATDCPTSTDEAFAKP